jgi:hypothetical protein
MSNELRFDIVVHGSPSEINAIKNCVDYDEEAVGYERNYEVSEETLSATLHRHATRSGVERVFDGIFHGS